MLYKWCKYRTIKAPPLKNWSSGKFACSSDWAPSDTEKQWDTQIDIDEGHQMTLEETSRHQTGARFNVQAEKRSAWARKSFYRQIYMTREVMYVLDQVNCCAVQIDTKADSNRFDVPDPKPQHSDGFKFKWFCFEFQIW